MALPPERIAVKRRRQEDPVEALFLQENINRDQKRRFTDYYFKLLRNDATPSTPSKRTSSDALRHESSRASVVDTSGIPVVRSSAPGDEIEDFKKFKAAQEARRTYNESESSRRTPSPIKVEYERPTASPTALLSPIRRPKHFHLARTLGPHPSGGIRKAINKIRPPLATFVERQSVILANRDGHVRPPIDKILNGAPKELHAPGEDGTQVKQNSVRAEESSARQVDAFVKPLSPPKKLGTSINDHPSTWDLESDQLADELAALAMELEPGPTPLQQGNDAQAATSKAVPTVDTDMIDGEFVYETYVRMPQCDIKGQSFDLTSATSTFGVLIIDEEDQELWEQYMEEEDEESDWDEEDSNAEDNPANEYPDDEVSSDDEFGRNPYNYRHNASDDEEYGDESDDE